VSKLLDRTISINKICAIIIGIGIALTPIHNQWLTRLVTSGQEVSFFIPSFGVALWFIGSLLFVTFYWGELDWGEKRIHIPLIIIVIAIGLSGINADTWGERISPFFLGVALFALYLTTRILGKDIFLPIAIGAGLASLGVIVHGVLNPGKVTGGYIFEGNYDIVVGYILLGVAMFVNRWRWLLAGLALVAMFISGSPEGVFVVIVVVIYMMARRDWSRKLVVVSAVAIAVAIIWVSLGWGLNLYGFTKQTVTLQPRHSPKAVEEITKESGEGKYSSAVGYRIGVISGALHSIKAFGEGYNLTAFSKVRNVHNVPLVIVQQLGWPGVLAGVAWLWVTLYCLIKTRWKYAWVTLIALCVWDHYIWTQMAPVWWALIGVSTKSSIKSDLIFKKQPVNYIDEVKERYNRIRQVASGRCE